MEVIDWLEVNLIIHQERIKYFTMNKLIGVMLTGTLWDVLKIKSLVR